MNLHICDYCSEKEPLHKIKLSRTPNGEEITAELCSVCLNDIRAFKEENI